MFYTGRMEETLETSIQVAVAPTQPDPPAALPKRRRGAQPGNHNALKHGLYARATQAEARREPEQQAGLQAEVEMLHSLIRRMFAMADGVDNMEEMIEALRAVGMASTRLAVLLRTQRILTGGQDSQSMELLVQALAEIYAEIQRGPAEEPR